MKKSSTKKTTGNNFVVELLADFDKMQLHIEYNSALYSENLIKNFAACYENVLRQLMTKTFISEVELLDDNKKICWTLSTILKMITIKLKLL